LRRWGRLDIEQALVSHLLADSALTAIIGDRLYPQAIPETSKVPAVVYQRISSPRTLTLDGSSSANNPRIQFSCYAASFGQAKQIAMKLYESLDCFRGVLGNKTKATVLMADNRDDFIQETGRYLCGVDFFVLHTKKRGG
jgi:hypothetical protein